MVSFRLGNKVHSFKLSTGARRMKKAGGAARLGLKHSGGVADRAEMVESVANKVAGGLGTAATLAALTGAGAPVAGGLAAAGGAVGSVGKVAGVIGSGARKAQKVDKVVSRVEDANRRIDRAFG